MKLAELIAETQRRLDEAMLKEPGPDRDRRTELLRHRLWELKRWLACPHNDRLRINRTDPKHGGVIFYKCMRYGCMYEWEIPWPANAGKFETVNERGPIPAGLEP